MGSIFRVKRFFSEKVLCEKRANGSARRPTTVFSKKDTETDAGGDRLSLDGVCQQCLQRLGREVEAELAVLRHGDAAGLLGDDDDRGIGHLGET